MVAKGSIAGRRRLAVPELVPIASSADAPHIATNKIITTIGSKSGVDVRLSSKHISGAHALLINIDNNVYVCDLISRTGVFVNDKRVRITRLLFGDMVRFGNFRYRFSDEGVLRKSANVLDHGRPAVLQGESASATIDNVAFIIGRRAGAGLVIESNLVSSAHAIVIRTPDKWIVADLHSRTGTTVNGRQIQVTSIRSGDTIRVGSSDLIFSEQEVDASADSSMYGQAAASLGDESIESAGDAIEAELPVEESEAEVTPKISEVEPTVAPAAELPTDESIAPHEATGELPGSVGLHEFLKKAISAPLFDSPDEHVAAPPVADGAPVIDEAPSPAIEKVAAPASAQQSGASSPDSAPPVRSRAAAQAAQAAANKQLLARMNNRPRRPARPQRPQNPSINNSNGERQKWGPLATAVADTKLLELVAVSRRRQMPTHRLAPARPAQKLLTHSNNGEAAAAPRRKRRLALAGAVAAAVAIVSGAAWYVISHPSLVAQLW